jgi:hypothetical protein
MLHTTRTAVLRSQWQRMRTKLLFAVRLKRSKPRGNVHRDGPVRQHGEGVTDASTDRRTLSGRAKRPQAPGRPNSSESTGRIRARKTERVLRKLNLSGKKVQAVGRLPSSLDELVHKGYGPHYRHYRMLGENDGR